MVYGTIEDEAHLTFAEQHFLFLLLISVDGTPKDANRMQATNDAEKTPLCLSPLWCCFSRPKPRNPGVARITIRSTFSRRINPALRLQILTSKRIATESTCDQFSSLPLQIGPMPTGQGRGLPQRTRRARPRICRGSWSVGCSMGTPESLDRS